MLGTLLVPQISAGPSQGMQVQGVGTTLETARVFRTTTVHCCAMEIYVAE